MNLSGSPDLRMVVIILLRDVPRCLWQERLQTKVSQKSIAMDASDFVLLPGFRGVGSFGAEVRGERELVAHCIRRHGTPAMSSRSAQHAQADDSSAGYSPHVITPKLPRSTIKHTMIPLTTLALTT